MSNEHLQGPRNDQGPMTNDQILLPTILSLIIGHWTFLGHWLLVGHWTFHRQTLASGSCGRRASRNNTASRLRSASDRWPSWRRWQSDNGPAISVNSSSPRSVIDTRTTRR